MTRTVEDVDEDLKRIAAITNDYSSNRKGIQFRRLWEKLDELLEERWLLNRKNATLNQEVNDGSS